MTTPTPPPASSTAFVVPAFWIPHVEAEFGPGPHDRYPERCAVTMFVNYLAVSGLEWIKPAKGHGARKKRMYAAIEARDWTVAVAWAAHEGLTLEHVEGITGAWEVEQGIDEGLRTDYFWAEPPRMQAFLREVGRAVIDEHHATMTVIDRVRTDWTLMDTLHDTSLACFEQLGLGEILAYPKSRDGS